MGKGKWISGRSWHFSLVSQPLSTSLSTIFSPLFVLGFAITSLFPLRCIPHSFVILPRKQIREPSLSRHTFPLSHSAFLCFCVLRFPVGSRTLVSHHTSPWPATAYDVTQRSKGCWVVTQGQMSLCPASISAAWKRVVKCSFFPFRRVLPLFGESVSCSRSPSCPFKEFQSGSLVPYFSSSANFMCLYVPVIILQSLLFAPIIEWSHLQRWLLINFHGLFSFLSFF